MVRVDDPRKGIFKRAGFFVSSGQVWDIAGVIGIVIRIAIAGASGQMGRKVVHLVDREPMWKLVAVVSRTKAGCTLGSVIDDVAGPSSGLIFLDSVEKTLQATACDVLIDFTSPQVVQRHIELALRARVRPVVGTTGLDQKVLTELRKLCLLHRVGCIVAPNFSIGAVLMMIFSAHIAQYMPHIEIIESHHDRKRDAPSGTAIKTSELILHHRPEISTQQGGGEQRGKWASVRGAAYQNFRLHSVRLPSLVAHQKCLFARSGEMMTIRHDCWNREAFMPGIRLAVLKVMRIQGMVYGLENLLDFT
ncbi:4-hydroxy-tetrahydrodipicolinate reductase [Pasteuria penetrans]|uniref:4-hydroxy-tetrahydrodipicolinate reductase n=1 Tax=Pasteuria penetrans TaxID=86005 RepID=UPI000FA40B8C|nr:4-hydroxy-tetrahydrodipicolinate reductase [Pasteuria penetrans]